MPTFSKQKGASGQCYENKLVTLFLLRATEAKEKGLIDSFHLASNQDVAHPFDDVVFAYKSGERSGLILLQAKHKENPSKINFDALFKTNEDKTKKEKKPLGIKKYLDGFVKMNLPDELKGPFDSMELVLYTNSPLEKNDKKLRLDEFDPNEFYRMGDKKVGKIILDDDVLNSLNLNSDDVNTGKIKDFFDSFRLAYDQPNEADLEFFIIAEIASFYSILPSEAQTIYDEVSIKVRDWWKEKNDASYLTEDDNWFDTSRNNLSQKMLEITYKSTEELEQCIKSNKIINVVCNENTKILSCVHVYQTLKTPYILLDDTPFEKVKSKILKAFKGDCCLLVICSFRPMPNELIQIVSDTENKQVIWIGPAQTQSAISTISLKVGFSHLIDQVQKKIKIKLQGKLVPLVDLVDGSDCDEIITDDLLVDLLTGEVIVGRPLDGLGEVASYHIPRILKRKGSEEQYRSDQIRPDDDNKLILISACPGMGKSTLVSSMMGEKFRWKYRINLIRHSKLLQNQQNMEALLFLKEAIVMSDYEYKLFKVAYEKRGSIVLYLDGFDEIAPDYKLKVLQLFQSLRSSKVDEVWVTTRPGFEEELEMELNTTAFHLEPFSRDKQKDFLKNIWNDSDDNKVEDTLRKIYLATNYSGFTTIPLHLKMISEMRNEIISSEMNILILYEKFFRIKFYEVAKKGKLELDLTISDMKKMADENYEIVWDKHEKLALLTMFEKHDLMQVISIQEIKEIMKIMVTEVGKGEEKNGVVYGIIDDKPAFTHRTYAEFFAASWMKNFYLKNCDKKDFRQLRIFFHLYRDKVVGKFFDLSMCGDSEACRAVLSEDYRKLEEMSRDELLKQDKAGRTVYHLLRIYRNEAMEHCLKKKKAYVNSRDILLKFTPSQYAMMFSVEDKCFDLFFYKHDMKLYLKYVFYENGSSEVNKNLHWACANGDLSLLENSIENGADVNKRDDENVSPLHLAAAFGHIEVMKILIENGALLNEMDCNNFTPLLLALSNKKLKAVEFLITKRADLNIKDNERNTPLHWTALLGHASLARIMIDHGADVNAQNEKGFTALHMAAREGHLKVVQILLRNKADLTLKSFWDVGSLGIAAEYGHSDVVGELLRHGADLNEEIRFRRTPIANACKYGHDDVVKTLIDFGADPNLKDNDGSSPLLIAAKQGHVQTSKILINHGADPNVQNKHNETPLFFYVKIGDKEMTQVLLYSGADPNQKTGYKNWTAIYYAALRGSGEIVKMFLDRGAGINETTEDGRTLLHLAAAEGHIKLTENLINWGANVDPIDKYGWTPLFHAAYRGCSKTVEKLLDNGENWGANVDPIDENSRTPLHGAAYFGCDILQILQTLIDFRADPNLKDKCHVQTAKILLNHGADPNVENKDFETPLYLSVEDGHEEMTQVLLDKGANPNLKTGNENWPAIYHAASRGSGEIVKMFLDRGADINETTEDGRTLLHLAAGRGHIELVQSLITLKANIDPIDENGLTPLFHAINKGHSEVVKILLDEGANVALKNKAGETPLQLARKEGHYDIVAILIAAGAHYELE